MSKNMLTTTNTYFTADLHLFHKNVIKYCNRPFDNVEEMHEAFILNWNKKISAHDNVFLLGDIGFANSNQIASILKKLNGHKYLILGNHDPKQMSEEFKRQFVWIKSLDTIKVLDEDGKGGRQKIVLCHYAMRTWDCKHHGAWHLFGHSHGTMKQLQNYSMDVGVDCHNYTPVSYQEIKDTFKRDHIQKSFGCAEINLIVAMDNNDGIGYEGSIPWKCSGDMKFFKETTTGHTVVMGRKTLDSLPNGPLPNRKNIVISTGTQDDVGPGVLLANSPQEALNEFKDDDKVFIVGGKEIYKLFSGIADNVYLTRVDSNAKTDVKLCENEDLKLHLMKEEGIVAMGGGAGQCRYEVWLYSRKDDHYD